MSAIALPTNAPKTSQKKSSAKDKGKGKQKTQTLSNTYVDDTDDEEPQAEAALVPPGAVPLSDLLDEKEFDYDELKDNNDLELCIIRIPDGVKPKNLDNLKLTLPPSASTSSIRVGTLSKKNAVYDIWSVRDEASDETTIAGGDEVLGLSCLVPRKKKGGKLFAAPRPIVHHLVFSAQPAQPTPPVPTPKDPNADIFKGPPRYKHPKHLLKHRFLPTGAAIVPLEPIEDNMDIDLEKASKDDVVKEDGSPKKKRKVDADAKTKKVKTGV